MHLRVYRVAVTAGSGLVDLHLHCVVDGALEPKVATTMLMLGLVRKSTFLDDAARCMYTSSTHQGRRVLRSLPRAMM
jgi:hypothetical protein